MSTLYVTVDTNPMANSVHEVSQHVDNTTIAIVAMKAATVAAEQSAADNICENVNRGFHSLVLSQISQKCAKAKSIVDAKIQELNHFGADLRRVHGQMERDFHRIAGRYTKTFQSLNNSLKIRIYELDKTATDLASVQMPQAMRRMLNGGVQAPIHQRESLSASQAIASSIARRTTLKTIGLMCNMLQKTADLQTSMNRIIDNESPQNSTQIKIPAVLFEADDLNLSLSTRKVHLPEFSGSKNSETEIFGKFAALNWVDADMISNPVREQTRELLSNSKNSERVRTTALKLLDEAQWKQMQAGGE